MANTDYRLISYLLRGLHALVMLLSIHTRCVHACIQPVVRGRPANAARRKGNEGPMSTCRILKCARTKCTGGNWRAGEQAGLGPTARGTGGQPHLPTGKLVMRVAHVAAQTSPVLQLEGHVIPRCARARASEAGRPEVRDAVWGPLNVVESEQWATRRATERALREPPQTSFGEGGAD